MRASTSKLPIVAEVKLTLFQDWAHATHCFLLFCFRLFYWKQAKGGSSPRSNRQGRRFPHPGRKVATT